MPRSSGEERTERERCLNGQELYKISNKTAIYKFRNPENTKQQDKYPENKTRHHGQVVKSQREREKSGRRLQKGNALHTEERGPRSQKSPQKLQMALKG